MKIELVCPNCEIKLGDISGKRALDVIKKYDTIVNGKPFTFRCVCQHDLHLVDAKTKKSYIFKNDKNRVAEI